MAEIKFKAKAVEIAGRNAVKVPTIKAHHCNMAQFRTGHKLSGFANSNMFQQVLARELRQAGVTEWLYLDNLPACVSQVKKGFILEITINI